MKRVLISSLLVALFAAAALAHDPRTVAKNFSHSLTIEGAGKLTLSYKSLHYNETNFNARKQERALVQFNRLWKAIGKLDTDFEVVIGAFRSRRAHTLWASTSTRTITSNSCSRAAERIP
ncbi:MAG TPA: hypothetical protein VN743_06130 [Blastocatellia bacterium]|nr:hypothetical protein [Blastocatellia bacterium]